MTLVVGKRAAEGRSATGDRRGSRGGGFVTMKRTENVSTVVHDSKVKQNVKHTFSI